MPLGRGVGDAYYRNLAADEFPWTLLHVTLFMRTLVASMRTLVASIHNQCSYSSRRQVLPALLHCAQPRRCIALAGPVPLHAVAHRRTERCVGCASLALVVFTEEGHVAPRRANLMPVGLARCCTYNLCCAVGQVAASNTLWVGYSSGKLRVFVLDVNLLAKEQVGLVVGFAVDRPIDRYARAPPTGRSRCGRLLWTNRRCTAERGVP